MMSNPGVLDRGELYAGGWHVASYVGGSTYFNHADWLGTVRVRTGPTGAIITNESYASLPFGDCLTQAGGLDCNYGVGGTPAHFTDQDRDTESGLDHFMFRQYSSTQGRWMTPDPAGMAAADPMNPQTWNRYAYVAENPMNATDPLGLVLCYTCGMVTAADAGSSSDSGGGFVGGSGEPSYDPGNGWPFQSEHGSHIRVCSGWTEDHGDYEDGFTGCSYGPSFILGHVYMIEPVGGSFGVNNCDVGLATAQATQKGVQRAINNWTLLSKSASGNYINVKLLAAIALRETDFRDKLEVDGAGVGVGVFQITVSRASGVTAEQAHDLSWSAHYAANMLRTNGSYLANRFPNFTPAQLLQATAASYNMNPYKPGNFTVSAISLDGYLKSKSSPMNGEGQNLMNAGQKYNLDPRLLVALAGAETGFGKNETRGAFNAWNWLWNAKHPSQSSFASYAVGEMRVASGLVRLYDLPNADFGA